MTGMIFDIQRGALHDGPGIRTTVFFKGCPLRCAWCHNPESQKPVRQLSFTRHRCTDCRKCEAVCKYYVHSFEDGFHKVYFDNCTLCGECVKACCSNALSIYGEEKSAEDIFNIIKRDTVFYAETGGVTLSGGEPLSQPLFAAEILKRCKDVGIGTAVETSGQCSVASLEKVIPFTDIFLFDWKISDDTISEKYIGASTETIKRNLAFLCEQRKNIILRCPIIPGVNDTHKHYDSIIDVLASSPYILSGELLPYHNFGISKAESINAPQKEFEKPNIEISLFLTEYFRACTKKVTVF